MSHRQAGGSFAPPIDDAKLGKYRALAAQAGGPVKDAMQTLLKCVGKWWDLPESRSGNDTPHPSGRGLIRKLDKEFADQLDELIPWEHELKAMAALFGELPDGQEERGGEVVIVNQTAADLRNAAHHLLWYVKELNLDREPITRDKL